MAKRRVYKRDRNGRFATTGGGPKVRITIRTSAPQPFQPSTSPPAGRNPNFAQQPLNRKRSRATAVGVGVALGAIGGAVVAGKGIRTERTRNARILDLVERSMRFDPETTQRIRVVNAAQATQRIRFVR